MIEVKNTNFQTFEQDIRELLSAFFPGDRASFSVDIDKIMEPHMSMLTGLRFEDKSTVKRALYDYLSAETGKTLPWGTLTGIKPVRLAEKYPDLGILKEKFRISEEKARLILGIADRENKLLSCIDRENGYSMYIGIPFCPTRCLYCSFTSNPISRYADRVDEYLSCLEKEIKGLKTPETLYIGGGTPTALNAMELEKLMKLIHNNLEMDKVKEFTVEAGRPDSITEDKLKVLKDYGVERISINPQTMNEKTLKLIGRAHTPAQCIEAFEMARSAGFDNINTDLIMGLPGETLDDVSYTLSEIEKLHPESLTVHALAVKRSARLSTDYDPWSDYERAEGDEVGEMISMGRECAERLGMVPYYLYRQKNIAGNQENTGYAVPGKECLYNIIMMEEKQAVVGLGAGSTTKLNSKDRNENVKDLKTYFERIDEMVEKRNIFLNGRLLY
ncbi:MAG: coproporphyrinogen dehydrogenase HemZ [Eubacteriales bacterium]|nr:coproporphyrinogen dehydrogenase HemZ [Eubacteriales bacterium]